MKKQYDFSKASQKERFLGFGFCGVECEGMNAAPKSDQPRCQFAIEPANTLKTIRPTRRSITPICSKSRRTCVPVILHLRCA